jgi:hypothetical protein
MNGMDNFQYKRYKWPTAYSSFPTPPSRRGVSRDCGHNLPVKPYQTNSDKAHQGWVAGEWRSSGTHSMRGKHSSVFLVSHRVIWAAHFSCYRPGDSTDMCTPGKRKEKNGGVGPNKTFHRCCIQMSVPRRLVLIEWEETIQSDLIGSFSTLIGSFSLYTNQSECEIGWSSTKCASTCSLCFLLEYFSWVLFGLFPPLSCQSSQCI